MPFQIIRNDITKVECDAIVNAANNTLLGGGGVDGAIHSAAGPELLEECKLLNGCETGQAKITNGYRLPAKFVIHTVGPVWQGGKNNEESLLRSCYQNSLQIAKNHQLDSIAFPLISAGVYGYPKKEALRIATEEIITFLSTHDMFIYLVVFDRNSFEISQNLYDDVLSFVDEHYVDETNKKFKRSRRYNLPINELDDSLHSTPVFREIETEYLDDFSDFDIDHLTLENQIDESFSEMLLRIIEERHINPVDCYKKANIDRKLFSKIKNNKLYTPSKSTVIAFAFALELSYQETCDLLMKAGYALSNAIKFDVVITYFLIHQKYNLFEVNEVLFKFDLPLLGY